MSDGFQDDGDDRDLLGDPIDQNKETWGRPSFEKTKEKQELVMILKAAKWSNERIARRIGCDIKTLRKHFSLELSEAADRLEAEALAKIAAKMREGNVSAARQVLGLARDSQAAVPEKQAAAEADEVDVAEQKLGKKERLNLEAQQPSSAWSDLLN